MKQRGLEQRGLKQNGREQKYMKLRAAVWALLMLSWLAMLFYAWSAFSTIPSAERLARSHMAQIPTLATVGMLVLRSALELAVLLALTWPWSARAYTRRVALAAVLLPIWFLMTAPLSITLMEWVHRRWLAGVEVGLLLVLMVSLAAKLRPGRGTPPAGARTPD